MSSSKEEEDESSKHDDDDDGERKFKKTLTWRTGTLRFNVFIRFESFSRIFFLDFF